jgi:hypothetical protein
MRRSVWLRRGARPHTGKAEGLAGMSRKARIRILGRPRRLGCGCWARAGETVVSTGPGKPWLCAAHQRQLPVRTVAEVLAAAVREG